LLDRISTIERQIHEAREGNTALQQISERIVKQKDLVDQADKGLREAKVAHDSVLKQINDGTLKLETLLQDASSVPLTPHQIKGLDERFTKQSDSVRLESLDKVATAVERGLNTEIGEIKDEITDCEKEIEARFAHFIREWKAESGGLDATLASAPDFFAKLVRLETDGLPAYEQRFFELLQNQSHQNLVALSTYLNDARKAILDECGHLI